MICCSICLPHHPHLHLYNILLSHKFIRICHPLRRKRLSWRPKKFMKTSKAMLPSKARPISGAMGILHSVPCNGIYLPLNHMVIVRRYIPSCFTRLKLLGQILLGKNRWAFLAALTATLKIVQATSHICLSTRTCQIIMIQVKCTFSGSVYLYTLRSTPVYVFVVYAIMVLPLPWPLQVWRSFPGHIVERA
jgi:hypothetical protein